MSFSRITDGRIHPPNKNEYLFPGSSGTPVPLCRLMRTPLEVSNVLLDSLFYRGTNVSEISKASGVSERKVKNLVYSGKGKLGDLIKVNDALSVYAAALPDPRTLRKGI